MICCGVPVGMCVGWGEGNVRTLVQRCKIAWVHIDLLDHVFGAGWVQVGTPWRKAQSRLEGEEEYEALDKVERLEVFTEYMK